MSPATSDTCSVRANTVGASSPLARYAPSPHEDTHWSGVGVTNYVDIEWTEAMDLDAFITLEILEADVPSFPWRKVYSSGREVRRQAAKELKTLMASTLGYQPGL